MAVQTLADAAIVVRADFSRTGGEVEVGARRVGRKAGDAASKGFVERLKSGFGKGGSSAADSFAKGFGDNSGAFGRVIATMAAKVTIAGAAVAAAAPGVTQLTAALIPAAGAAVALPAALLAGRAAALTFKVAVSGVGDAIQKGFTGSAKEAQKALDQLPPSARRFASAIIATRKPIEQLKASVAGRFFGPLQNEVKPLADLYIPNLQRKMSALAGGLGNLGEQVAQSARKTAVFKAVNAVFDSATASAGRLRAGIDPLMRGLAAGLRATAPLLPGLASGLARVATNVGNYVRQAADSGRIVQVYRNAVGVLRTLGQIAGNVGSILSTVWKASDQAGGNLLTRIRDLTGQARRFVESGQGMTAITATFKTMSSLGDSLRTGLGAALPAIAQSVTIAAPALSRFAAAAAGLVVQLAPLLPHVTQLAVQILTALLPAIISLTGWMQRNQSTVQKLAPIILGATAAIYAHRAAILVVSAATRAWSIVMGAAKVAQAGWTAISWLASAPVAAHTAAMRLSTSTIGTWVGVKGIEARAWLSSTASTVRDTAAKVGNRIATAATTVATLASAAAAKASAIATATWSAVTTGATAVMKGVRIAVLALNAAMRANPIGVVITVITLLVAALVVLYKRNETVRRIVDACWKGIKTAISAVGAWFSGTLMPSIKRAIDQGATAFRFIQKVASTVWGGIRAYIGAQIGLVIKVFTTLKSFVTVTLPNAFRSGVGAIQKFWAGLQEAARKPVAFVVNTVINPFLAGFQKIAGVFGVKTPAPIRGFATGGRLDAEGGQIPGTPSSKDNRLGWLKDKAGRTIGNIAVATGEFIVNARDTAKALPLLRWINDGMKGGPADVARRIGRRPTDRMGDGSEGWAFAGGGLVGFFKDVWGAISDPVKLVKRPFEAALGRIPGGGMIRDLLLGMGRKLIGGVVDFISGGGGSVAGGNIGKAQAFVRAQAGKPYVWASAGPGGYDCSGIVSAVYNVLKGKNPYSHTFSTGSLPGPFFREGQRVGPLVAGWAHPGQRGASANVGHMAGMIGGLSFESTGSRGVHVGTGRKPSDFAHIGVAKANGGLVALQRLAKATAADTGRVTLAPGQNLVWNGLGRPEHLEEHRPGTGAPARMHPDDIDALARAIGDVLGRALLGTVPATKVAARQAGRRPGR
jgi:hypothetical protein